MKKNKVLVLMATAVMFVANFSVLANAPKLTLMCQVKVPSRLLKD